MTPRATAPTGHHVRRRSLGGAPGPRGRVRLSVRSDTTAKPTRQERSVRRDGKCTSAHAKGPRRAAHRADRLRRGRGRRAAGLVVVRPAQLVHRRRVGLPLGTNRGESRRSPPTARRPLGDAADAGLPPPLVDVRAAHVHALPPAARAPALDRRRPAARRDATLRCRPVDLDHRGVPAGVPRCGRREHPRRVPDDVARRVRARADPAPARRPRRRGRPARLVGPRRGARCTHVLGRRDSLDRRGRLRHARQARLADCCVAHGATRGGVRALVAVEAGRPIDQPRARVERGRRGPVRRDRIRSRLRTARPGARRRRAARGAVRGRVRFARQRERMASVARPGGRTARTAGVGRLVPRADRIQSRRSFRRLLPRRRDRTGAPRAPRATST